MDRLEDAFRAIKRQDFVVAGDENMAWQDRPLPIGYNQTISQPTTVRMMLDWLDARPGHKVLDVGSGSGWTTALLSHLVGPDGSVCAVERIPELVEFGRINCQKYNLKNIKFYTASREYGLLSEAPFDRILVSAAAHEIPNGLIDQLGTKGRLVIPVQSDILVIERTPDNKLLTQTHHGFAFVPLI